MMNDADRAALMDWITARRNRAHVYGTFDCCTLCADYLVELRGMKDPMKGLRGTYDSRAGAQTVMKKGGGLKKIARARLGVMHPMAEAECGSIVYGDYGDGPALGICTGFNIAAAGEKGLVFSPLSRGEGCWTL